MFRSGHRAIANSMCFGKIIEDADVYLGIKHARCAPIVISTDFLSVDERSGLFGMSDVLVHASRSEGYVTSSFLCIFLLLISELHSRAIIYVLRCMHLAFNAFIVLVTQRRN